MEKLVVDQTKCIGCGACVAIDPEHFDFNDEGKSNVISNENIESENVTNAIESCPTSAISLMECESETNSQEIHVENEEACDCEDCNGCEGCEA